MSFESVSNVKAPGDSKSVVSLFNYVGAMSGEACIGFRKQCCVFESVSNAIF